MVSTKSSNVHKLQLFQQRAELECHIKAERGHEEVDKLEVEWVSGERERENGTDSVRLSAWQCRKMLAIFLDRFPFKDRAPRGC